MQQEWLSIYNFSFASFATLREKRFHANAKRSKADVQAVFPTVNDLCKELRSFLDRKVFLQPLQKRMMS